MLEELDSVNWSELTHAYGPANDVPEMIRALTSEDKARREWGMLELIIGPTHSMGFYDGVPDIVRFLIELLTYDTIKDKDQLVMYIANASECTAAFPFHEVYWCNRCMHFDWQAIPKYRAEYINQASYEAWRSEPYPIAERFCRILHENEVVFFNLLDSDDPTIRAMIPPLLYHNMCKSEQARRTLAAHITRETEERAHIAAVFFCGMMCRTLDVLEIQFVERVLNDDREIPTVRIAGGFGLIGGLRDKTPDPIVQTLAQLVRDHPAETDRLALIHEETLCSVTGVYPYDILLDMFMFLPHDQRQITMSAVMSVLSYSIAHEHEDSTSSGNKCRFDP